MKRRMGNSAWGRYRGMVSGELDGFTSPASVDPVLARRSTEKLAEYMDARANYGRIDKEAMKGSDGVLRWYAFRYAEHPGDPIHTSPHPGVDYLVGPVAAGKDPGIADTGIGVRGGLAAVAIVGVAMLLLAGGNKR